MKKRAFKQVLCFFFAFVFCFGAMNVSAIDTEEPLVAESSDDFHAYAGITTKTKCKGIQAIIKMPSSFPDVSGSGESAWVSTSKDDNRPGKGEWVQAGARYYPNSIGNYFIQYTEHYKSGVYQITHYDIQKLNSSITYKVEFDGEDEKWHAFISGVDMVSGSLNENIMTMQAKAEVHKENIEMGPFTFSRVRIKNGFLEWENNTKRPTADSPYSVSSTSTPTQFTVSGPN